MPEFTGERVIPNHVDPDLWNEHYARYLFATRLSNRKRVLDIACGSGYGSAELAATALAVTAIDKSADALAYAREHFARPNIAWLEADATAIPLPDASFDLITAFEVIEHLADWSLLLAEANRLLAPGGQFVVSTPNKAYYAETRKQAGPNPFHEHEFEFDEFQQALRAVFPHVTLWVQNHTQAVVFQPVVRQSAADLRMEHTQADPASGHFFLAVCASSSQLGAPAFLYLPSSSNVLRERELHIARLEEEVARKTAWLENAQQDHSALLAVHRTQTAELESRNRWAAELDTQLTQTAVRVQQLQEELAAEQQSGRQTAAAYEAKLSELDTELSERTQWALDLQRQLDSVQSRLDGYLASRWTKLGRTFGLGPKNSG